MAWVIGFSDDAWDEFDALPTRAKDALSEVLFERWVQGGPVRDRTVMVNGVVMPEATFPFGVTVRWVEWTTNSAEGGAVQEAIVLKVRLTEQ